MGWAGLGDKLPSRDRTGYNRRWWEKLSGGGGGGGELVDRDDGGAVEEWRWGDALASKTLEELG